MHAGKIVLVSSSSYIADSCDALLRQFVDDRIELFCVVGVDAERWEEALDWLCIGPEGHHIHLINTTSHPRESVEEVMSFAESFQCKVAHKVEVVYV
jgi:hypothetical protein